MQVRAAQLVQVSGMWPASRLSRSDRECPLHTARDRCLWHAGGTAGENADAQAWRRRLPAQPEGEVRPRWPPSRGQEPAGLTAGALPGNWDAELS